MSVCMFCFILGMKLPRGTMRHRGQPHKWVCLFPL